MFPVAKYQGTAVLRVKKRGVPAQMTAHRPAGVARDLNQSDPKRADEREIAIKNIDEARGRKQRRNLNGQLAASSAHCFEHFDFLLNSN